MSGMGQGQPNEEVEAALREAVAQRGPEVLSNPQVLANLLSDLLPDAPREASLLLQAAEVDVRGALIGNTGANMDPDTAVRLAASSLEQQRALAPGACVWATTVMARALGYPVTDPGVLQTGAAPTVPAPGQPDAWGATAPAAGEAWGPSGGSGQPGAWGTPPSGPPAGGWSPDGPVPPGTVPPGAVPPPGGWSSAGPEAPWGTGGPPSPPPQKRTLPKVLGAVGAVVAVLLVYGIVAAAAKLPPFGSSTSTTIAGTTTTSTTTGSTSTTSGSTTTVPGANPAAFLQAVHSQPHFTGLSDSNLTALGNDVCQDYANGSTTSQVEQDALKAVDEINANDAESGNNPGGNLDTHDAGFLIGASVQALCPQYLDQLPGS
jgi:hypothetical protein